MAHKRYIVIIIILSFLAYLSFSYTPKSISGDGGITVLPKNVEGWEFVRDIHLNDDTYRALDPKSLIFRDYRNSDGNILTLTVVYHQNDRWGPHDPLVCYTSQGWKVLRRPQLKSIKLRGRPFVVNEFIVTKNDVSKIVYFYWFSSGKKITPSRNKQMIDMALNGIFHGFTESGFVEFAITLDYLREKTIIDELNFFVDKFTPILEGSI